MREIVRQHKISLLTGCILIPFLLAVPLVQSRSADGNYTGVINTPGELRLFLLCCLPPFLYLLAVFYRLGLRLQITAWQKQVLLFLAAGLLAVLIPYGAREDFFSGLHVLVSYLVLGIQIVLMCELLWLFAKLRRFYLGGILLAFLLAVTVGAVSGLSEWVYLTVTSVSLTVLQAVLPAERKSS